MVRQLVSGHLADPKAAVPTSSKCCVSTLVLSFKVLTASSFSSLGRHHSTRYRSYR